MSRRTTTKLPKGVILAQPRLAPHRPPSAARRKRKRNSINHHRPDQATSRIAAGNPALARAFWILLITRNGGGTKEAARAAYGRYV